MDTTTHRHLLDPVALDALGGRTTGRLGEDLAVRHLTVDDGCEVVARNWRLAAGELRGELDVIALDHARAVVVACEVKARRDAARFGGALAAVTPRKLSKVRALAAAFLRTGGLPYRRVRIDVVAVDLGRQPVLHHLLDVR
jgi:putative endonuclease